MRLRNIGQSGFAICLLSAAQAWAGGLMLYEIGTPDSGLAAAGWAARAQDPATVATNPAGMTRLDGDQVMVGAQALYADLEFSSNANTTVSGGDGDNPVEWFPGASAFFVHSLAPDWKLGLGMYGNFGLVMDNDDDWVGRYNIQDATILGMMLTPALAYKVNDRLSIGAGLNAMYGDFEYEVAVRNAWMRSAMANWMSATATGVTAPIWACCMSRIPAPAWAWTTPPRSIWILRTRPISPILARCSMLSCPERWVNSICP